MLDLFIIGGGVNGCGIARDATGRGLSVALAEMGDLGSATSSSSTKLLHGGLRYLEYFELRLVREALQERETLLKAMPHISWPMRFVLPIAEGGPLPRSKAARPAWLIRSGLFLYDSLGGRKLLPPTSRVDLGKDEAGQPLQSRFRKAYEYSDCWVDDARLVVLNARDAHARGARIMTYSKVVAARRFAEHWEVDIRPSCDAGEAKQTVQARVLVNATGPWVSDIISSTMNISGTAKIRLVRGSHIVIKRLFTHNRGYCLQGTDGRIVFALPYERDFTLIGTTDSPQDNLHTPPKCAEAEQTYLLDLASQYFAQPLNKEDIVWTYSGVRPLYDDGAKSATAATRDYVLELDTDDERKENTSGKAGGGPRRAAVLNVFGGKITTYRKLAEAALEQISEVLPGVGKPWTATASLAGGDFPIDGFDTLVANIMAAHPFLSDTAATRLARTYGTEAFSLLRGIDDLSDMGQNFGHTLTACELSWGIENEWVRCADDFLWRRTKLGLHLSQKQQQAVAEYINTMIPRPGHPE